MSFKERCTTGAIGFRATGNTGNIISSEHIQGLVANNAYLMMMGFFLCGTHIKYITKCILRYTLISDFVFQ